MKQSALEHIEDVVRRHPDLACCRASMREAAERMAAGFRSGGRLLVCGNGGSCADAFHIVAELMKGFVLPRPLKQPLRARIAELWPDQAEYLLAHLQGALPAVCLAGETALSTAFANDEAADLCFAQQVVGQGRAGDVLLAISTSGRSQNVLHAARVARAMGLAVVALTGGDGGTLKNMADVSMVMPRRKTHEIQELHLPVYHALCLALEEEFFGGGE